MKTMTIEGRPGDREFGVAVPLPLAFGYFEQTGSAKGCPGIFVLGGRMNQAGAVPIY